MTEKSAGLVLINVGNGKGKTTAAMGTVVRALGSGLNVLILQFVKGEWPSGERDFFEVFSEMIVPENKSLGKVKIKAIGRGFVKILGDKKPFAAHKTAAQKGLVEAEAAMKSGKYDLVVLDELLSAYESKLITLQNVKDLIDQRPPGLHLIVTGHKLPPGLKSRVDLVTEMKMIKHPYYKGILAQRGIDY